MLKNNPSGKILTVFIVIAAVLLISLTAVSIFFFQQEVEKRKFTEVLLEKTKNNETRLDQDLKETKKQAFLLEEKNKELDERINGYLDDLELEKGLREAMKKENASLKEDFEAERRNTAQFQQQIAQTEEKFAALNEQLKTAQEQNQESQSKAQEFEKKNKELEDKLSQIGEEVDQKSSDQLAKDQLAKDQLTKAIDNVDKEVNLDKIVVGPEAPPEGRILSVDADTEFVIVNLGTKDGIGMGNVMAVYRGKEYLGDIKITRVQSEMSAADFIPPFSSRKVRKNDQVVLKNDFNS